MKSLAALLLLTGASAFGSTLVVNNNSNNISFAPCSAAAYTTIGAALTAANPGDTVDVCPSTYPEAVYINKKNIKLTGLTVNGSSMIQLLPTAGIVATDPNPPFYTALTQINTILLVDSVTGVQIYNIFVDGSEGGTNPCGGIGNAGIYFRNASGTVTDSVVAYIGLNTDGSVSGCQEGEGIYIDNDGGTASVTVTGTSIHDFDKDGISAVDPGTTLVAKNNAITGVGPTTATAQNGVEVNVGAKGTLTNNVIAGVDYTPTSSNGTGILFYQAAANSEANDNTISDANVGIEFYEANNGTANGNNISKAFNWNALVAVANHTEFEHNVIADAGLQQAQPAVYLCGSNNKVENNTISEAIIGVQDDRTSADDCSGSTGNTKSANVYTNVGTDSETLTDEPTPAAHSLNHNNRNSAPRPLPKP
jgi:parallel beta-helix repeat protein